MKFSCRKACQNILNANKELRKLDMKEIGFAEYNPIFYNQILEPKFVHILSCYDQKLNVFIHWKESVAFLFQEVLLKSKWVKIVYRCQ